MDTKNATGGHYILEYIWLIPMQYLNFASKEAAINWMESRMDEMDGPIDNVRFCWKNDAEGLSNYKAVYDKGCCGFFDCEVRILGRKAFIGCNFGH